MRDYLRLLYRRYRPVLKSGVWQLIGSVKVIAKLCSDDPNADAVAPQLLPRLHPFCAHAARANAVNATSTRSILDSRRNPASPKHASYALYRQHAGFSFDFLHFLWACPTTCSRRLSKRSAASCATKKATAAPICSAAVDDRTGIAAGGMGVAPLGSSSWGWRGRWLWGCLNSLQAMAKNPLLSRFGRLAQLESPALAFPRARTARRSRPACCGVLDHMGPEKKYQKWGKNPSLRSLIGQSTESQTGANREIVRLATTMEELSCTGRRNRYRLRKVLDRNRQGARTHMVRRTRRARANHERAMPESRMRCGRSMYRFAAYPRGNLCRGQETMAENSARYSLLGKGAFRANAVPTPAVCAPLTVSTPEES